MLQATKEINPSWSTTVVDLSQGPANLQPRWQVVLAIAVSGLCIAGVLALIMNYWGIEETFAAAGLSIPMVALIGMFSRPANPVLVLALGAASPAIALSTAIAFDEFAINFTPNLDAVLSRPEGSPAESLATFSVKFGQPTVNEWLSLIAAALICVLALYFSPQFSEKFSRRTDQKAS